MRDLAVVIVSSPGRPEWLGPCLRSVRAHAGGADLQVVVVENEPEELVADALGPERSRVGLVRCANRGFGHANNRGAEGADARWLLFLNPDTEIVSGDLASLLAAAAERPRTGVFGVRQLAPDGTLLLTARRFPSPGRALADALGVERLGRAATRLGERVRDERLYAGELEVDWTAGSFLLVPRAAWEAVGGFDERFFLYAEEVDLCRRMRDAGWAVRHLPRLTIVHHVHSGAPLSERMHAQLHHARRQYASKHMGPLARRAYLGALAAGLALRAGRGGERAALSVLLGRRPPPLGPA